MNYYKLLFLEIIGEYFSIQLFLFSINIRFIIGLIIGANISLFLYACILASIKMYIHIENEGGNNE